MALFLFDTVLSLHSTLPNNQELSLALGRTTIVHWTSTQSLGFVGLSVGGGAPVDGMVVCFSNLNNNGFQQDFAHESLLANSPTFRFRNMSLTTATGGTGAGAIWYRYNGAIQRWVHLAGT